MSKITLNARTIVRGMFDAAGNNTNIVVETVGYNNNATTSLGTGMSTQGSNSTVLMPSGTKSSPLYLHNMVSNLGELRRHPSQISRVLHFDQGNYSLFASSIYQENLPNADYTWTLLLAKDSLAIPNKSFVFDTETPNDNLYVATAKFAKAAGVKLNGVPHCDPLKHGNIADPAEGDKIVMLIKSSTTPNCLRIVYNMFSAASGPTAPSSQL